VTWAWELKSVNGRNLDVRLRVPPGYDAVAEEARRIVAARIVRGAVQVGLSVQRVETRRPVVRINTAALTSLTQALRALPADPAFGPATLDGLLQVRGVVEVEDEDEQPGDTELHARLIAGAEAAAADLARARSAEGAALLLVLTGQLERMRALVSQIEHHPARSVEAIRARLHSQVAALLEGHAMLDADRLHQEAALLATRADVREELDRLGSHLDASLALLGGGGAVGRKLDFLAQEFGREASTLCAKANHVELSRIGIELRALVDQFREQAQNVE
jgi:uncharacterized protein (TIGR00255 family)